MIKILILGSNSFSGSHLSHFLLKKNFKIIGCSLSKKLPLKYNLIDKLEKKILKNFKFYKLNINKDLTKLKKIINNQKPEFIIDFMGQGMVAESWEHPYSTFKTNVLSKIKLYNFLLKKKFLKKYIKISTPEIFGSNKKILNQNNHNPSTPYALSHSTIEKYLMLLYKQYKFPVVISRFANFYGPYQKLYRLIPLAIHSAHLKQKFFLHGGGASRRSFIYCDDFCEGIFKMIKLAKPGDYYQFSSKDYYSIKQIVFKIYKLKKLNPKKFVINVRDRIGKDKDYKINDNYSRKKLTWRNKFTLNQGIQKVIDWHKKNFHYFNKNDLKFKIKI